VLSSNRYRYRRQSKYSHILFSGGPSSGVSHYSSPEVLPPEFHRTIKIKNTIKPTTEITLTKYHHPLLPISCYLRTDIDTVGKANIAIYSSPEVLPPEFHRTIKIKNTIKPTTEITLTKYHHPLLPISCYLRTDIDTVGKANIAIYSSPEVLPPEFHTISDWHHIYIDRPKGFFWTGSWRKKRNVPASSFRLPRPYPQSLSLVFLMDANGFKES